MTFDVRKRAAVHEAAHAVATKAYGSLIHLAEICVDNPEWCGRVCHEVWGAWENVVVCLAGAQGELAFFNNEWGSGHDLECAKRLARKVDPDYRGEVIQSARTAAAKIVRDNRTVISVLAVVLEHKGKLSDVEIDGVIGSISGTIRPGPSAPDMTPLGRAQRDATRRRARRDYEGAAFIERWIRQQEHQSSLL
jgi:hypothetical protein